MKRIKEVSTRFVPAREKLIIMKTSKYSVKSYGDYSILLTTIFFLIIPVVFYKIDKSNEYSGFLYTTSLCLIVYIFILLFLCKRIIINSSFIKIVSINPFKKRVFLYLNDIKKIELINNTGRASVNLIKVLCKDGRELKINSFIFKFELKNIKKHLIYFNLDVKLYDC